MRSRHSSWSPKSQRSRHRCGSAENAKGQAGSVNSVMATVGILRGWQGGAPGQPGW